MKLLLLIISTIILTIVIPPASAQVATEVVYDTITTRSAQNYPVTTDSIFVEYDSLHYFCGQRIEVLQAGSSGGGAGGGIVIPPVLDTTWTLYQYDGDSIRAVYGSKQTPFLKPKRCLGVLHNRLYLELESGLGYYDGTAVVAVNGVDTIQAAYFLDTYMVLYSNKDEQGGLYQYDGNTLSLIDSMYCGIMGSHQPVVIQNTLYFSGALKGTYNSTRDPIIALLDPLWQYDGVSLTKIDSGTVVQPKVIENLTSYHNSLYYTSAELIAGGRYVSYICKYDGTQVQPLTLDNDTVHQSLNVVGDHLYYTTNQANDTRTKGSSLYQYHDSSSSSRVVFARTPNGSGGVAGQSGGLMSWERVPLLEYNGKLHYLVGDPQPNTSTTTWNMWQFDAANPAASSLANRLTNSANLNYLWTRNTVDSRSNVDAVVYNNKVYLGKGQGNNRSVISYDGTGVQVVSSVRSGNFVKGYRFQVVEGTLFFLEESTNLRDESNLMRLEAPITNTSTIATVQDLQVYPNPTTGMLTLQTAAQVEAVYLYNLAGKLILSPTVNNIDISSLASGVYIVQVKTDKGLLHKKVVKQ